MLWNIINRCVHVFSCHCHFFSSSLCLCCIILHSVVIFAFRSISAEAVFALGTGQNIKPCWNSDSVCLHNMSK